jgi:REP element-mobilizing transposase RayT
MKTKTKKKATLKKKVLKKKKSSFKPKKKYRNTWLRKQAKIRRALRGFAMQLKLPSLWTHSYFVSTAGNVSSAMIQRYIEEQSRK